MPEDGAATTPALTLSEAAKATGKHRNTLRNRLEGDAFPNAYRDNAGAWRIPVPDLIAAGFIVAVPSPEAGAATSDRELDEVREDVARLRERLAVAEALADERRRELERLVLELERLWSRVPPALPSRAIRWPWSKNRD